MNISRRSVLGATVLGGLALAGCSSAGSTTGGSSAGGGSQPASTYMVAKKTGPLLVGFANSFAGNAYRAQMILELKEQAKKQASDIKDVIVTDANGSVDKQLSDINDLVTKGVDILMIDAASATALNTAVERAQKAGILVVSFDNNVTSTAGIAVNVDQKKFGQIGGDWLVTKLKKGDSIFTLDGSSGSPVNDDRLSGAATVLKAAGITIVAGAPTDWDQASPQTGIRPRDSLRPAICWRPTRTWLASTPRVAAPAWGRSMRSRPAAARSSRSPERATTVS